MKQLASLIFCGIALLSTLHAETITYAWGWAPDGQRLFRTHLPDREGYNSPDGYVPAERGQGHLWVLLPNRGQCRWHGDVDDAGDGWIYTVTIGVVVIISDTWDIECYSFVRHQASVLLPSQLDQFPGFLEEIENGGSFPVPPNYRQQLPLK